MEAFAALFLGLGLMGDAMSTPHVVRVAPIKSH